MNKLTLVFFATLFSMALHAQAPYQLFRPGVQYLYEFPEADFTESQYVGIKVEAGACTPTYSGFQRNILEDCQGLGHAFIGAKVCQTDSTARLYFTDVGDTTYLEIRTLAPVNQPWPANIPGPGENQIWGEVKQLQEDSFLGLTDSVKYIYFFTINNTGGETLLPAPNRPLKVSRQYGLVGAFWLHDFPIGYFFNTNSGVLTIAGMSNPQLGIQDTRLDEVFNLQMGDELHIYTKQTVPANQGYYFEYTYLKATITGVSVNAITQVLQYQYMGPQLITRDGPQAPAEDTLYDPMTEGVWEYYLPDLEFLNQQPGSVFVQSDFVGTISVRNSELCDRTAKYVAYPLEDFNQDGCLGQLLDGSESASYIDGLGGPYYNSFGFAGERKRLLQYYRKGADMCGTPFDFSSVTSVSAPTAIDVTLGPNPTSGPVTIHLPIGSSFELALFDAYGRKIKAQNDAGGTVFWDLTGMPAGVYYLRVAQHGRQVGRYTLQLRG